MLVERLASRFLEQPAVAVLAPHAGVGAVQTQHSREVSAFPAQALRPCRVGGQQVFCSGSLPWDISSYV